MSFEEQEFFLSVTLCVPTAQKPLDRCLIVAFENVTSHPWATSALFLQSPGSSGPFALRVLKLCSVLCRHEENLHLCYAVG